MRNKISEPPKILCHCVFILTDMWNTWIYKKIKKLTLKGRNQFLGYNADVINDEQTNVINMC